MGMAHGDKEKESLVGFGSEVSESIYLQILNAMSDMILVKGKASKIIWANRAFSEFYGMSNQQLAGMIDAEFNQPDHTAQYIQDDEKVFRTGLTLDIPEEPVTRHDGVVRTFHSVKSPIFDENGKTMMTVGISRDITEKLKMQQSLDLERARAVHSSKMATLGEMAANIAHEMNTPLSVIHGLSGHLLELVNEPTFDRKFVMQSLEKIESTALRISRIITGLNKFAKDTSKDVTEMCNLEKIVEDALSFAREKIAFYGIRLEIAFPPHEMQLECNPALLAQVILNLLTNARDAVMGRPEKWIRVEAFETESYIELAVIDSGAGIPPENQEKIFTPFVTSKSAGDGIGLGLSISRSLVESRGGRLFLDLRPGPTRFVMQLPKTMKRG